MFTSLVVSTSAQQRLDRADAWLGKQAPTEALLVVAGSLHAANMAVRRAVVGAHRRGVLGWHRLTLPLLAARLAESALADEGWTRVSELAREATVARVVFDLGQREGLGRYQPVMGRPGLPQALASTLDELRMGGVDLSSLLFSQDLHRIYRAYLRALGEWHLADRAHLFEVATEVAKAGIHPLLGAPMLLLDVPVTGAVERRLVEAVAASAPDGLATAVGGDRRAVDHLKAALGISRITRPREDLGGVLGRVQSGLFGREERTLDVLPASDDVRFLSAPSESLECVEIARQVLWEARQGTPFEQIAVLLRAPGSYRGHLVEALRRAQIPAHLAEGTRAPDPAGRAFVALLACAAEGLSASRFAEYMSLGQLPEPDEGGAPPPGSADGDAWQLPEGLEELGRGGAGPPPGSADGDAWQLPEGLEGLGRGDGARGGAERVDGGATVGRRPVERAPGGEEAGRDAVGDRRGRSSASGTGQEPRRPKRWERLLVDAAVIGGRDRWIRRLAGVRRELGGRIEALENPAGPAGEALGRALADLDGLEAFALPLLADLEALPERALWGEWLPRLRALASRTLACPNSVLRVLGDLGPMAEVGPVTLQEVQLVLARRLVASSVGAAIPPAGAVFVADVAHARGLAFDVVFVPGLAERLFPQKVMEDPVLLDKDRRELGVDLVTQPDRARAERLALRIAVGAARRALRLSYPRLDMEKSRPRVPSFYALEVIRAAEGRLTGFEELTRRAARVGAPRVGWPAPDEAATAIERSEFDLATLAKVFAEGRDRALGGARYLLSESENSFLPGALRARARRALPYRWTAADGLVDPNGEGALALAAHQLGTRSFSATALQAFSACPYRFFLYTVHRLQPHEVPTALEEMDALTRGSMIHEIQERLLRELSEAGRLPVTEGRLSDAVARLERILEAVEARYRDDLAPAIERVWRDGVALVAADLREWLTRQTWDASAWVPRHFELSFGLSGQRRSMDPASVDEPVALACGLTLRGAIDLVEEGPGGVLRATDYKTGRVSMPAGATIDGGRALQPVLYALALETLLPGVEVVGGRLHYCTARGAFEERWVPLDDRARAAADRLAKAVGVALDGRLLPAAPREGACRYCDYRVVCGEDEERRTARKGRMALHTLRELREMP